MDCSAYRQQCLDFGVRSVPKIKIYKEDKKQPESELRGSISMRNIEKNALSALENNVQLGTESKYAGLKQRALVENKHLFIIFPSTKKTTSALFMSLSTVNYFDFSSSKTTL